MPGESRELPELSPVECRRLAEDAATKTQVTRSIMWSLLAIAGELAATRRETRTRR